MARCNPDYNVIEVQRMDARLDSALESWGNFTEKMGEAPVIPGRLSYDPLKGVKLELVENRSGNATAAVVAMRPLPVIFGRLVDGTLVTLLVPRHR